MAINAPAGGPEAERTYLAVDMAAGVLRCVMPHQEPETFGEMIERLRNRLPKAYRARPQFAELAEIAPSTLEKIETGVTQDPDVETVRRIAKGFAKATGQPVAVSSISSHLKWVPVDEVGSDWFFAGLSDDDRELLMRIAGRLRLKAEDPPEELPVARRRAARS